MGEITVEQIVSVDGYAADDDGGIEFFQDVDFGDGGRIDHEQMGWLETVDAILLGRRTYEMFAAYWPHADPAVDRVAEPIARLPKHVFSNTLGHAPWGDGQIDVVGGVPADAVREIAQRYDSTVIWGSLQLTDALFEAGLVHTLRLRIIPVLLGRGRSFTPPAMSRARLRLEGGARHDGGIVTEQYRVL